MNIFKSITEKFGKIKLNPGHLIAVIAVVAVIWFLLILIQVIIANIDASSKERALSAEHIVCGGHGVEIKLGDKTVYGQICTDRRTGVKYMIHVVGHNYSFSRYYERGE